MTDGGNGNGNGNVVGEALGKLSPLFKGIGSPAVDVEVPADQVGCSHAYMPPRLRRASGCTVAGTARRSDWLNHIDVVLRWTCLAGGARR